MLSLRTKFKKEGAYNWFHSQHIADHTHTPHISAECDLIEVHYLGRHKLRCAEKYLELK